MKTVEIKHPFLPVIDNASRVLVLGSFPSVQSREHAFYYAHTQNRFWRVLSALFDEPLPHDINEKTAFLYKWHIALWDVVSECEITGSADSTLKPYSFNDIISLLEIAKISTVFTNGRKAGALYHSHLKPFSMVPMVILPSTSPANAAWSTQELVKAWTPLRDALRNGTEEEKAERY